MDIVSPAAVAAEASPADKVIEWCTAAEVAAMARTSQRRVHQAVRRGELRAATVDARGTLRIHRSWVRQWLEQLADRTSAPACSPDGRRSNVRDFKAAAANDRNGTGHE